MMNRTGGYAETKASLVSHGAFPEVWATFEVWHSRNPGTKAAGPNTKSKARRS
jgi:hypothetical protein